MPHPPQIPLPPGANDPAFVRALRRWGEETVRFLRDQVLHGDRSTIVVSRGGGISLAVDIARTEAFFGEFVDGQREMSNGADLYINAGKIYSPWGTDTIAAGNIEMPISGDLYIYLILTLDFATPSLSAELATNSSEPTFWDGATSPTNWLLGVLVEDSDQAGIWHWNQKHLGNIYIATDDFLVRVNGADTAPGDLDTKLDAKEPWLKQTPGATLEVEHDILNTAGEKAQYHSGEFFGLPSSENETGVRIKVDFKGHCYEISGGSPTTTTTTTSTTTGTTTTTTTTTSTTTMGGQDPDDIADCTGFWYKGNDPDSLEKDDEGTLCEHLDPVWVWEDQLIVVDAIQATEADRPIAHLPEYGAKYVEFDGSNDNMTIQAVTPGANNFLMVALLMHTAAGDDVIFDCRAVIGGHGGFIFGYDDAIEDKLYLALDDDSNNAITCWSAGGLSLNTPYIVACFADRDNDQAFVYINSTSGEETDISAITDSLSAGGGRLMTKQHDISPANPWDGRLYEIQYLHGDNLVEADVQSLIIGLNDRWGVF